MKKVKYRNLEAGRYFRRTKNGPIYMKDNLFGAVCIIGKQKGRVIFLVPGKEVIMAKVKILEN